MKIKTFRRSAPRLFHPANAVSRDDLRDPSAHSKARSGSRCRALLRGIPFVVLIFAAFFVNSCSSLSKERSYGYYWQPLNGRAFCATIGAERSIFYVGTDFGNSNIENSIYQYKGDGNIPILTGITGWKLCASGSDNTLWIVKANGDVVQYHGGVKAIYRGIRAREVAVSPFNVPHVLCEPKDASGNYGVKKLDGDEFIDVPGRRGVSLGIRGVMGDPEKEELWLVRADDQIYRYRRSGVFEIVSGKARRITASPDGSVWIVNNKLNSRGEGGIQFLLNDKDWSEIDGAALNINVGPYGDAPVVINADNIVHVRNKKGLRL